MSPRSPTSPQFLANFVVELSSSMSIEEPKVWTLFVDGDSNLKGRGLRRVLE